MEFTDNNEVRPRGRQFVRGACRAFASLKQKRIIFLWLLILTGVALIYLNSGLGPETWKMVINFRSGNRPHRQRMNCPLTKVELFGHQIMSLMNLTVFMSQQLNCSERPQLGIFKKAAFHVEGHILVRDVKFPEDVKCCFHTITRVGDDYVRVDDKCNEMDIDKETTAIQLPTETISVTCKTSKDEVYYKDGFQMFHLKPEVEKRIIRKSQESEENGVFLKNKRLLSVAVICLDTVSQAHFERAMPKTKSYLDTKLSGVRLLGYNGDGSGSLSNVVAFLAGMNWNEFSEVCLKKSKDNGSSFVDRDCPLLWKTFQSQGYHTLYAEDYPSISLFNTYHRGFPNETPTDYYWRPMALLMEKVFGFTGRCYGPRSSHTALLDAVKQMANLFNVKDATNNRHFSYMHSNRLGHSSMETVPFGDKPTLEFIQYLHEKGHLNHTALFLLGDHGENHNDDVEQAMIESRMPLAYIVLPPWFSQRYSKPFRNLQWNAEKSVTSHFDMHKTILDILDLERFDGGGDDDDWRENRYFNPNASEAMRSRGQSLFEWNPEGRDCESAGIRSMWCLCYKRIPLRRDSFLAVKAAQAVIDEVNLKVANFSNLCEILHVRHIISATLLVVKEETWEKPECQQLIDSNSNTSSTNEPVKMDMSVLNLCKEPIHIYLSIVGSPLKPRFKTVAIHNHPKGFSTIGTIVREDWYSSTGHCISNVFLKPFCICKDLVTKIN